MSINVILECPSKSKRYNIEITNDVTPFQLEQEFKEQFFNKEENLRFYFQNQLLIHNKPLVEQKVVKGSLIIIGVSYKISLNVPILNKLYQVDIDEFWTTADLTKKLLELLQFRSEEVSYQLGLQVLKPQIWLSKQDVISQCTVTVNIQQRGGRQA
ncbi:unnamed protein product (macronuclear) [Paramecium tetraurelia]|uniref:Ubiquitin-like domain-containing protein n=1 Tax=Paramecium tetraurelia TaxID=5888 RepID=A0DC03_PARTE|nr:uncharacterized protein GSPATT00015447001 [Paramecium tetraurelia]CAK80570.1 unnamed protein product [Paramecium tetraurelia]|eukprot:XP_001447967.1 hypothetical protein (macronuclear) [Paramecium tetraurelia strain d4-2]